MNLIGNIIWILFGGLIGALGWVLSGLVLCLTVIGIPFGLQCFKLAGLQLAPFGREIRSEDFGSVNTLFNILWILFFGWEIALFNLTVGLFFCITIIGIPFGIQSIKLARVALFPFGTQL